jgi:hypothetical protein
MRRVLAGIMDDLSFDVPKDKEGSILATLRNTNDEDAVAIAGRIFNLYLQLDRLLR